MRKKKIKKVEIRTNVKYTELREYRRRFESEIVDEIRFVLYVQNIPFDAIIKYGIVEQRLKYDRRSKFKIYFDGVAKKKDQIKAIENLFELPPSEPILMLEILFAKENQQITKLDNGNLEYHFTFLQY